MSLPLNLFLKASWLCSNSVRGVAQRGCSSTGALNSTEGSVVIVTVVTAKAIEQVVSGMRMRMRMWRIGKQSYTEEVS